MTLNGKSIKMHPRVAVFSDSGPDACWELCGQRRALRFFAPSPHLVRHAVAGQGPLPGTMPFRGWCFSVGLPQHAAPSACPSSMGRLAAWKWQHNRREPDAPGAWLILRPTAYLGSNRFTLYTCSVTVLTPQLKFLPVDAITRSGHRIRRSHRDTGFHVEMTHLSDTEGASKARQL